jgi:hypothetical protein
MEIASLRFDKARIYGGDLLGTCEINGVIVPTAEPIK